MILDSSQNQHSPPLTGPWDDSCFSAAGPSLGARPDHRRDLTLCPTWKKKILEDGGYRLEGAQGLLPQREAHRSPSLLRSRATQKEPTFTPPRSLLHPPEASWWCTHQDKMSGCCSREVRTHSSWRAQDPLPPHLKAPLDFGATQRVDLGLLCVSAWSLSPHYQTQGLPGKLEKD